MCIRDSFGRLVHGGQLILTSIDDELQLIISEKKGIITPPPEQNKNLSQAPIS